MQNIFKTKRSIRFWILITGVFLSLFFFEEIVDDVFSDPREGDFEARTFDDSIASYTRSIRTPALNQIMTDITALGSVSVITVMFLVMASLLIVYRDYKGLFYISIVLAGGGLWPEYLKTIFQRQRPLLENRLVDVHDFSFPSGHTFGATSVYIALAFYAAKYAKSWSHELYFYVLGILLIVLVGLSRIYLGVHFPTDVLGGIAGGLAWGLFVSAVVEFVRLMKHQKFHVTRISAEDTLPS